jgi:hypothetical protein
MADMSARPADPMTAQDGARIQTSVQELSDLVKGFSNRIANLQMSDIRILELLSQIESGLSESRVGRLEAELKEVEIERNIAEQRYRAMEEKLEIKKNANVVAVDTNEKIKAATKSIYDDLQKQKEEDEAAFWKDLRRSIVKAVLISLSVGAVTGTVGFIWWLVMLYVNR